MTEYDTLDEAQAHPGVVRCHLLNGKWQAYVAGEAQPADGPPDTCPPEVTMRQARLALLAAGKLAAVDTAINAMSEPAKTAAKIEWEYSQTVQRHKPLVLSLGPALGLSSADIDALFNAAAAL